MKPANFSTLLDDIRDTCLMLAHMFVRAAKHIATLPWPALLACAFLLAFALTLVPLALFLFVILLALKLVATAIAVHKQRHRRN